MVNRHAKRPYYWAVVPAAGVGRRMGSDTPKQYLSLAGKTVIAHTVERLLGCDEIQAVMVAVGGQDEYFQDTGLASFDRVTVCNGGAERCHSVQNALQALWDTFQDRVDAEDWVLVHDAARPCISVSDIQALIRCTRETETDGVVLGVPVRDTMKRTDKDANVIDTVDRRCLWHAQTPQLFRLGPLQKALRQAIENGQPVTDEASAMELAGYIPRMLEGSSNNIKITLPADLALADFLLGIQT